MNPFTKTCFLSHLHFQASITSCKSKAVYVAGTSGVRDTTFMSLPTPGPGRAGVAAPLRLHRCDIDARLCAFTGILKQLRPRGGARADALYLSSDCPQSITALLRMVGFLAILSWHPHETPEPEPGCQSSTASSSTTSWPLRPRRCAAAHGAGVEAWRKFPEAQETQFGHVGNRDLDLEGCLVVCPSTL